MAIRLALSSSFSQWSSEPDMVAVDGFAEDFTAEVNADIPALQCTKAIE